MSKKSQLQTLLATPISPLVCLVIVWVCILTMPTLSQARRISAEWNSYPDISTVIGYRLYHENSLLCQTLTPDATSIECNIDTADGETWFTLATLFEGNIESPHSTRIYHTFQSVLDADIAVVTASSGEAPLDVSFSSSSSTGNIVSYQWTFGDGDTATGENVNHTFISAGNYTVTLTVTDGDGATDTAETLISVSSNPSTNNAPKAVISSTNSIGTAPFEVDLNGQGSYDSDGSIISYHWDLGDGTSKTGAHILHTYTTAGTFHPTLTVTDDDGATNSISTPIIVESAPTTNLQPIARATASTNRGKASNKVTFNGSKSSDPDGSITSFMWHFGDGSTATGKKVTHNYSQGGRYTVLLIVTDNMGATDQASLLVSIGSESEEQTTAQTETLLTVVSLLLGPEPVSEPEANSESEE